jgi:hypothetical protein
MEVGVLVNVDAIAKCECVCGESRWGGGRNFGLFVE